MSRFLRGRTPGLPAKEAEAKALSFMATMPAWRNHPRVRGQGR
jgi:hypothetical protein